jgi:hypothetical protein
MADIVFLDIETLGLDPDAPIWEFAAIRRGVNGCFICDTKVHLFIEHNPAHWVDDLPPAFQDDYRTRYAAAEKTSEAKAVEIIACCLDGAIVIGCNPGFDLERITKLLGRHCVIPCCHYHPLDIASVAIGFLSANRVLPDQPWKSDALAEAVGVDSRDYARHTAMGDVEWTMAQWDKVIGDG